VVVTYGSMAGSDAGSVTLTLLALVSIGQRAVVQKGMARAGPWPAVKGVMFVGYLPHGYLFPRAACVVHHGGAGTTHTTCAAGVPSVVVPHVGDQFYWATRLQRLGVAPPPLPRRKLTPGRLAERIRACIASEEMADRAQALAGHMAAEDGLAETRKLIESMNQ
jgi:UDP:flavonoid glycosyltransferase YjiC (YdhE family)